jgi:nucleoporin SEH1
MYPSLVASLGFEGRFKLWAEDPSAAPGRRFGHRGGGSGGGGRAAFETRSNRAPYRSFSMRHVPETRHTYLALLSTDGRLAVHENDVPEDLSNYSQLDEFSVLQPSSGSTASSYPSARPLTGAGSGGGGTVGGTGGIIGGSYGLGRGDETSFRVRFDPNPDPCYANLRSGLPTDALGLVVAALDTVRLYRSRDVVSASYGMSVAGKEFYLAAEFPVHGGLVRDVSWAPGNIRGHDVVATSCQDGYVRIFRVDTPLEDDGADSWTAQDIARKRGGADGDSNGSSRQGAASGKGSTSAPGGGQRGGAQAQSGIGAGLARSAPNSDRRATGQPGQVTHAVTEVAKLNASGQRLPVWLAGFDTNGRALGCAGDDGKLTFYRRLPDGSWAKSGQLTIVKDRVLP